MSSTIKHVFFISPWTLEGQFFRFHNPFLLEWKQMQDLSSISDGYSIRHSAHIGTYDCRIIILRPDHYFFCFPANGEVPKNICNLNCEHLSSFIVWGSAKMIFVSPKRPQTRMLSFRVAWLRRREGGLGIEIWNVRNTPVTDNSTSLGRQYRKGFQEREYQERCQQLIEKPHLYQPHFHKEMNAALAIRKKQQCQDNLHFWSFQIEQDGNLLFLITK